MKKLLKYILDFLLPPRCICCGKINSDDNGLCAECFNKITFIAKPYCQKCGMPFTQTSAINKNMLCPECLSQKKSVFRMARAAVKYDAFSKKSILALKFMDKTENAHIFAKWLKLAGGDIWQQGADILIPVPLHYTRLLKRRYNQSALLAQELGKLTGIKADISSLIKYKATKPQSSFAHRNARAENIKGAFKVKNPANIKGKRVVLIDDVFTTGATAKECAKTLRKAGALSVDILTIAKVYKG